MFGFEKLDVWHKAIEMSDHVYLITRSFPSDERFGLTSQMRRSAVSVASNIAEGGGRNSSNEFKRFIEIAYGSLMELVTQSTIARRQGFLTDADYDETYNLAQQIARMLSGLKSAMKAKN
jgi:four helix bundle protein